MDKNSTEPPPSSSSTTSNNNNNTNDKDHHHRQFLKHVNKLSHKIAKPTHTKKPILDNHHHSNSILNNPPPLIHQTQSQPLNLHHHQPPPPPQQHQPPVYNINKNDFRDVVQKLTGSPAHERFNTPPPIQPPKSTSSRLQKIRPPPLPQINSRPLNPQPLLSPLPPLPSVHAAAESPISAYMRYIQNSSFVSPRWSNFSQPPPPQNGAPATSIQFPTPTFGCVPSPKSPYPSLFSPTTLGFQQFPLSPTVPSPRWKGI